MCRSILKSVALYFLTLLVPMSTVNAIQDLQIGTGFDAAAAKKFFDEKIAVVLMRLGAKSPKVDKGILVLDRTIEAFKAGKKVKELRFVSTLQKDSAYSITTNERIDKKQETIDIQNPSYGATILKHNTNNFSVKAFDPQPKMWVFLQANAGAAMTLEDGFLLSDLFSREFVVCDAFSENSEEIRFAFTCNKDHEKNVSGLSKITVSFFKDAFFPKRIEWVRDIRGTTSSDKQRTVKELIWQDVREFDVTIPCSVVTYVYSGVELLAKEAWEYDIKTLEGDFDTKKCYLGHYGLKEPNGNGWLRFRPAFFSAASLAVGVFIFFWHRARLHRRHPK